MMLISEALVDEIAQRRSERWHFFGFVCDIYHLWWSPSKQTTNTLNSYTVYDRILAYTNSLIVLLFPAADSRFNWVPVRSDNCPISHLSKVEQRELNGRVYSPTQTERLQLNGGGSSCQSLFCALRVRLCSLLLSDSIWAPACFCIFNHEVLISVQTEAPQDHMLWHFYRSPFRKVFLVFWSHQITWAGWQVCVYNNDSTQER